MKKVFFAISWVAVCGLCMMGCTANHGTLSGVSTCPSYRSRESGAIAALNKQINKFNSEYTAKWIGISPINQRVFQIVYNAKLDQVICFDEDGQEFLVLNREPDGGFKGILKTTYHEAAFSGPNDSHSWGDILAEFYLNKGMF